MKFWTGIADFLRQDGIAALVSIVSVAGSSPREAGTRMVVRADGAFRGTIGGGALEWQMLAEARALLGGGKPAARMLRQSLGPDLGQCCGGQVTVRIEVFTSDDMAWIAPLVIAEVNFLPVSTGAVPDVAGRLIRTLSAVDGIREVFGETLTPVLLFGAGHVGRALVLALGPLPFAVTWVDQREDAFPEAVPHNVICRLMPDPTAALEALSIGALVAVMTHSHALDLAIISRALRDPALAYVGLIGSDTKRARFMSQLLQAGVSEEQLQRLVCPIGGRGIRDKSPAAIAAMIAAELLVTREA